MRYHSFLSAEDVDWGEKQVIRFRWILIAAILVLIGYIFLSGEVERGIVSLSLALIYIGYNSVINLLLRKNKGATWIRYVSSTIDVTVLSAHIFNYSYFFTPIAVSTAPSLFLYAILIMLSVLRYDGWLVVYTTLYVIICSNVIYFVRYSSISTELIEQVASAGPEGVIYRSVYFLLMGYFMFSIPKMINRLVEKQNKVNNERREIEIKLTLETQRKEILMQNLSVEQEFNKQLNKQKELILKQNTELENLITTKDKLFSIIENNLKLPFNIQCSLSEDLLENLENIEKKKVYKSIYAINKAANNGLNMLSNLMDWNLSQNGTVKAIPVNIKIKEIFQKVINGQSESILAKGIQLNLDLDESICVYADKEMCESIIRNLLTNAIKYTPFNGDINIKTKHLNRVCVIEIKDSGIGMNEEQLNGLFSVNNTISSLGTNNEKGIGLGLVLCKGMIDKNDGEIEVKSDLGKGTKFVVTLPICNNYH